MLSPGAVVLVFLLGSAEGYATVRDDRVFASSRDQQSKNSTTSDHDGDMKVSVGVQADASFSKLKNDAQGSDDLLQSTVAAEQVRKLEATQAEQAERQPGKKQLGVLE